VVVRATLAVAGVAFFFLAVVVVDFFFVVVVVGCEAPWTPGFGAVVADVAVVGAVVVPAGRVVLVVAGRVVGVVVADVGVVVAVVLVVAVVTVVLVEVVDELVVVAPASDTRTMPDMRSAPWISQK
jgi:hypothetical protein